LLIEFDLLNPARPPEFLQPLNSALLILSPPLLGLLLLPPLDLESLLLL
jgi:hypothetical protein